MPPVAQSTAALTSASIAVPSWVLDYLEPPLIKALAASYSFERASLLVGAIIALVAWYLAITGMLIPFHAGIAAGVFFDIMISMAEVRYRSLPEARAKYELLAKRSRLQVETKKMQRSLRRVTKEKSEVLARQAHETSRALRDLQSRFRSTALASYSVASASIPGIGPELSGRLWYAGITSAADVGDGRVRRIPGFGNVRTSAVVRWRRICEQMVEQRVPRVLEPAEEAKIRQKWQARYHALEKEENDINAIVRSKAWPLSRVEREPDSYVNITFAKYLKQAVTWYRV
jgi:DNA-binding helix-hairpin-helix protein with protein kinase domain